jgi:hypothetical protein
MAADGGKKNGVPEQPVIDFGRVPQRRWNKQWMDSVSRVTQLQTELEDLQVDMQANQNEQRQLSEQRDEATDDVQREDIGEALTAAMAEGRRLQRRMMETLPQLQEFASRQEQMIRDVLVSVPEDWWHSSAPEGMSLEDPEALDWLDDGRYEELVGLVQQFNPKSSKN